VVVSERNTKKLVLNTTIAFSQDFFFDFTNLNCILPIEFHLIDIDSKSTGTYQSFSYTALLSGLSYGTHYEYSILNSEGQVLR